MVFIMKKNVSIANEDVKQTYSYYSRVLQKPFDSLAELTKAEEDYYAEKKAKEDKATQKKNDAQVVEKAFKDLNAARKSYKDNLTQLTKEYAESLDNLKKAFELGKKDIHNQLAEAEEAYQAALKEFTEKYESYHITLKDGDFETTISSQVSNDSFKTGADLKKLSDIFDLIFNF